MRIRGKRCQRPPRSACEGDTLTYRPAVATSSSGLRLEKLICVAINRHYRGTLGVRPTPAMGGLSGHRSGRIPRAADGAWPAEPPSDERPPSGTRGRALVLLASTVTSPLAHPTTSTRVAEEDGAAGGLSGRTIDRTPPCSSCSGASAHGRAHSSQKCQCVKRWRGEGAVECRRVAGGA
jgi:hypothetical protein